MKRKKLRLYRIIIIITTTAAAATIRLATAARVWNQEGNLI